MRDDRRRADHLHRRRRCFRRSSSSTVIFSATHGDVSSLALVIALFRDDCDFFGDNSSLSAASATSTSSFISVPTIRIYSFTSSSFIFKNRRSIIKVRSRSSCLIGTRIIFGYGEPCPTLWNVSLLNLILLFRVHSCSIWICVQGCVVFVCVPSFVRVQPFVRVPVLVVFEGACRWSRTRTEG